MVEAGDLDRLQKALEATKDHLAPDVGLRFRAMFGGRGAYAYDRMYSPRRATGGAGPARDLL